MRRALSTLIIAALTITVAWWVARLPGNISASIAGITIQAATPVALVAAVLLVGMIYFGLRLLIGVFSLRSRFRAWRLRRNRAAGEQAITRTLVALAAGDQNAARREAARARRLLGDTPQTLLHAAEAARLAGVEHEATAVFEKLADHPDAAFLGVRGLFRQALAHEDWEAAHAHAKRAEALHPSSNWLRAERAELALRMGNWLHAIKLAGPDGSSNAAFAVAAALAEPDADRAAKLAASALKQNPDFVPAVLALARKLREAGRASKAATVLRDGWKRTPHPDIAKLALAESSDPLARLSEAQKLVKQNPDHPESLILLAQLSLDAGLIGEARRYAEAARIAGLNQPRLWRVLAKVEGGDQAAVPMHHDGDAGALAAADPVWRCDACQSAVAEWAPICPACKAAGRINWRGSPGA